jgi:hypothetical protein
VFDNEVQLVEVLPVLSSSHHSVGIWRSPQFLGNTISIVNRKSNMTVKKQRGREEKGQ